jgi:hypothetical protein
MFTRILERFLIANINFVWLTNWELCLGLKKKFGAAKHKEKLKEKYL